VKDLARFDLKNIFASFLSGLRSTGSTRLSWSTRLVVFGLPIVLGVLGAIVGKPLDKPALAGFLSANGLLVGSMITAFSFLANLRLKVRESDELKINARMSRQISETAVACLYVALIAIATVGVSVVGLAIGGSLATGWLGRFGSGVAFALMAHVAVVFVTVVRRLFEAYHSVFKADYSLGEPKPPRNPA
jgi:hypothetical protein